MMAPGGTKMLNEKEIEHGIVYAESLRGKHTLRDTEYAFLSGMIAAYETVLGV